MFINRYQYDILAQPQFPTDPQSLTYGRFDLGDFRKPDVPLCLAAQQRSGLRSELASSADERPN